MFRGHHRLRAQDGQWRWVLGAGGVLERNSDGKPLRLYGVQFDITEHKLSEEQRRLASERLAVIAEYVPGMIFQWRFVPEGSKGEFLYVSPGAQSVYGQPPEALMNDGAISKEGRPR